MKFRKKPVVIEATCNAGTWLPFMAWLDEVSGGRFPVPVGTRPAITRNDDGSLNIETREGVMRADVGDWVIQGVQGEFYPCKPDIFVATYEAIDA